MAAAAGGSNRWHDYYSRSFTPWDSDRCSSQLSFYLAGCASAAALPPCPAPQDFQAGDPPAAPYHRCPACQHLKPQLPGATALEIGCGTGASCVALAAAGFRVVGVDLVPAAVEAARQRAARAGVQQRCSFLCADCFQLPQDFGFGSAEAGASPAGGGQPSSPAAAGSPAAAAGFDLIYDCQTYHVLRTADEAAAAQLYCRLLRPGGLLMLLTGNANEPYVGPTTCRSAASALCRQQTRPLAC
jgi:SAM-dependent methyltransferase